LYGQERRNSLTEAETEFEEEWRRKRYPQQQKRVVATGGKGKKGGVETGVGGTKMERMDGREVGGVWLRAVVSEPRVVVEAPRPSDPPATLQNSKQSGHRGRMGVGGVEWVGGLEEIKEVVETQQCLDMQVQSHFEPNKGVRVTFQGGGGRSGQRGETRMFGSGEGRERMTKREFDLNKTAGQFGMREQPRVQPPRLIEVNTGLPSLQAALLQRDKNVKVEGVVGMGKTVDKWSLRRREQVQHPTDKQQSHARRLQQQQPAQTGGGKGRVQSQANPRIRVDNQRGLEELLGGGFGSGERSSPVETENEEFARRQLEIDDVPIQQMGRSRGGQQRSHPPLRPLGQSHDRQRGEPAHLAVEPWRLCPSGPIDPPPVPRVHPYTHLSSQPPLGQTSSSFYRDLRRTKPADQKSALGFRVKNPRQRSRLHQL